MSDVIGSKDFSTIKPFAFWTQHVLPLVYGDEISYMETLDKVVKLLNELIKNNNKLPDYIQKIVEEYITGGPLEEVLSGILANFILNVKYPPTGITPAKGDGTANDYEAIQGCIDYAANMGGGVVYFPFGKYLTSKLTLKPGVSLMGFGKYCTSIVLTGGETDSLISGTVNDCGIYNLTLDGNMRIQVNNVDVLTLTGYDIQLMNVILTDGYTLFNIEKTGDNIEINNVEFRYAVESMLRIVGTIGSINADNVKFGSLSTIRGVAAIISDSDNDVITGIVSNKALPLFAEIDGNNNVLKGKVYATKLISGDGINNVYDFYCRSKNESYSENVSETIHGTKSTHISGTSTLAVDSNSTESVDGNKNVIVIGVTTETYNSTRTTNDTNLNEIVSNKKVESIGTYEENINNTKTVNAVNGEVHTGKEMAILTDSPLKYGKPEPNSDLAPGLNFLKMTDKDDRAYYLLSYSDDAKKILIPIKSVKYYGAKGDGDTDDTTAIKTCIENEGVVYFPSGTYKVTDTLTIDDKHVIGENKGSTFLRMDGNKTLINAGSRTQIENITLGFFNADGAGYGEKIALNCMGSKYALQRTSIRNVNIWICGTAIKSGAEPFFSVNFDTMEISEFTYAAIQINTPDSTQNAFRNLYISSSKKPDYMFLVYTRMSSIYLENINLEHTEPKSDPLILTGVLTARVNGIQFEGITLTHNVGLMTIDCKNTIINGFTNIFNTLLAGEEYGTAVHIGECKEFAIFGTSDMQRVPTASTLIINDYTMWGFNFNNKSLTFARRADSDTPLNLYINGFGGVAYSDEISKYDIYVQAGDNTNVIKNINNVYGATLPTNYLTKYGELFFDTSDSKLKYYDGSTWKSIATE